MASVFVASHPLVRHHLATLRDKATTPADFRLTVRRLAVLLAYEATKDLQLAETVVETPLEETVGHRVDARVGLIPILRAGLGMVDPILDLIPSAEVWHLGLYRDEATAQPVEYYSKLPEQHPVDTALVLDPMLATGGSASLAIEAMQRWGVRQVKLLSIIAAQAGVDVVHVQFPNTQIYVCSVDAELNSQKFIVPGLGDAGDRTFNTL